MRLQSDGTKIYFLYFLYSSCTMHDTATAKCQDKALFLSIFFILHVQYMTMREVPVQSSISFYILSIPHAECITMQMPNLFLFLLSWSMHGKWMLWKLQKRTGTLKCMYTYLRHHIPHLLPRLLLAPPALSTSSLQRFIPAESILCCFALSFPVCGCDDDLRARLLC